MTITFRCPSGHRLNACEDRAGRKVRCPVCREYVVVPEVSEDSEPAAKEDGPDKLVVAARLSKTTPPKEEPPKEGSAKRASTTGPVPPPLPSAGPSDEPTAAPPKQKATKRRDRWADRRRRRRRPTDDRPPGSKPPRPRRSIKLKRRTMPVDVYQPDRGKVQTVRWLAFFLGLVALLGAIPALSHLNLATSPGWARLLLLLTALEAVYIVWLLATPDWSTVWVLMLVFAVAATAYGMATALAIATPIDHPIPLGMGPIRASAPRWCMAMLLMTSLATYLCGRTSTKWRRQFELEIAGKGKPRRGR